MFQRSGGDGVAVSTTLVRPNALVEGAGRGAWALNLVPVLKNVDSSGARAGRALKR